MEIWLKKLLLIWCVFWSLGCMMLIDLCFGFISLFFLVGFVKLRLILSLLFRLSWIMSVCVLCERSVFYVLVFIWCMSFIKFWILWLLLRCCESWWWWNCVLLICIIIWGLFIGKRVIMIVLFIGCSGWLSLILRIVMW